jgi:hypothetical protein
VWGNEIPRAVITPPAIETKIATAARAPAPSKPKPTRGNGEVLPEQSADEMKRKLAALGIPEDLSIPPGLLRTAKSEDADD